MKEGRGGDFNYKKRLRRGDIGKWDEKWKYRQKWR